MSEQRFDPYTGQPIEPQPQNNGYRFDPYTGQPIQQPVQQQPGYNAPQGYNAQQQAGYPYNQGMYAPPAKSGNKTWLFVLIGVAAVIFIAALVVGGIVVKNLVAKNAEVVEEEALVEASVEEEPIEEPVAEVSVEEEIEPDEVVETPDQNAGSVPVTQQPVEIDENSLFAVRIGEFVYQMPQPTKDFLLDGWTFSNINDADELIGTGDRFHTQLLAPGGEKRLTVSVTITNFSLDAVAARDAYICDLSFNTYHAKNIGAEVTTLGGKIKLGESTKADIEAAYGKPDNTVDSSNGGSYFYNDKEDTSIDKPYVMISFDENGVFDSIAIKNSKEPEGFVQAEVSDDAPAYLSKYVAPKELGDDPFSGNFMLDGEVYSLPVPLQVLVDKGWTYEINPELSVGAGEEYVLAVHKGDKRVTLNVANCDTKATKLKNTIVVMVGSYTGLNADGIEFPGGLTSSWTEKQVLQWFKDHGITDHEMYGTAYSVPFKEGHGKYEIYIDDDKTISFIHVRNYGWLRD